MNAVDTSPYYHPSEITLGNILATLAPEYPRESYYLISKVGRCGPNKADFNYSPAHVERSIATSLERLKTDYLDVALMHDAEFVCNSEGLASKEGFFAKDALQEEEKFDAESHSSVMNVDDAKVLAAVQTLFKLKERGLVRNVGISGYPLPILLRLSRLIACSPPYKPLDVILSYSNHTLQCDLLTGYREMRFAAKPRGARGNWKPPKLINASPLSMGLLTDRDPPPWHPANQDIKDACKELSKQLQSRGSSLATTALRYGIRGSEVREIDSLRPTLSTIAGLSSTSEVHQLIQSYRVILADAHAAIAARTSSLEPLCTLTPSAKNRLQDVVQAQVENERLALDFFKARGLFNWCWASPPVDLP